MSALITRTQAIFKRNIFTTNRYQHGYIILVPEIGEDSQETSFLQSDGLPKFNEISIENCRAAIARQTLEYEEGVKKLGKSLSETTGVDSSKDIFKELFQPLEKLTVPLDLIWGLSKTLYFGNSSLMPTSSYMAIHDRAKLVRASQYMNRGIYEAIKTAKQTEAEKSPEESRILDKFLLEGKLNGLECNDKERNMLIGYLNSLNELKTKFKQKVEMSTRQFSHIITDNQVTRDFPEELLKLTASDPNQPMKGPWKISLLPHIYMPVMEYCSDRELRWNLWQALVGRGSNYGDRDLRTALNLDEIRILKRDIAKVLGYETYADMSMETKMAGKVANVKKTIADLLETAMPAQETELKELYEFAADRGFQHEKLELWDLPYWRRKHQQSLFGYSDKDYKQYFPLQTVLDGLFQLCERLFNIVIQQRSNVSVWHKDVRFYDIFDEHSSEPVAGFYLDPYARSQEKIKIENTGWMVGIQNRSKICDRKPLAALIFNFDPPFGNQQAYLGIKEVKALFHKFGHSLQHLLTRTTYSYVSGLSGVEWDAVGVSGHVLSHWLYNRDVLDAISCKCGSGDKLPDDMFQALVGTTKHMSGCDLSRDLYLSSLDLELYSTKDFWLDIVKRLWPQFRCFTLHKIDSHPCSFTQVVSEDWAAAFYSHVWSRMVAADVYEAFEEARDEVGVAEVGSRFRESFLAKGGSASAGQVFREFRGRDPSHKALLRALGLLGKKGESEG